LSSDRKQVRRVQPIASSPDVRVEHVFDPKDQSNMLFERDRSFIVFISSKMAGGALEVERRAAISAVENFRPARAWAWERDAPAGSFYSEEECVRRAGSSDALVLIVEDELTRVTKAEFDAARAGTATVIVLARRGVQQDRGLERFISEARRSAITKEFDDLDGLQSEIDLALWEWFVRGGRTLALQTRERLSDGSSDLALLDEAEIVHSDGKEITLNEAIEALEVELGAGSGEEALWELYGWAATATDEGHFPLARVLLNKLREVIPAESIDETARGWILNLEGRIASGEGAIGAAHHFEQMRQIGIATDDKDLASTALQNLGVQAVIEDDHDLARRYLREGFELKTETDDNFGAFQIALNMCNVFIGEGEFEVAHSLLDDLEPFLRGPQTNDLQATVHGHRGMVLAKEGELELAKKEFQESLRFARKAHSGARQVVALQNLGANAMAQGREREALRWLGKAIAIADGLGDRNRLKILRAARGNAFSEADDWQQASEEFASSAQLAAELGDLAGEAEAWGNVAACWSKLGRPEEALRLIEQFLSGPATGASPAWRAAQLRNLGEILEQMGELEGALKRLDEASRLAEDPELRDEYLKRAAEIALAHPGFGEQALDSLGRSLDLQRELGTPADVAWRAANIGAQLSDTSQVAAAPGYFGLALRVFARNGDRRRAFYVRNDRGIALSRAGDLKRAIKDTEAALRIAEEIGDPRLEFQAQLNLGELERRRGRLPQAEVWESRALKLAQETSDLRAEGSALNTLGLIKADGEQFELAERAYKDALAIGRKLRDEKLQCGALGGLGGLAYRRGRWREAVKRFEQAVRRHGDFDTEALAEDLGGLALSRAARGQVVEAEIQRLVNVSGVIGWDRHAAGELAECALLLSQFGGDLGEAVSTAAIAITCALREEFLAGAPDDAVDGETLATVIIKAVVWMRRRADYDDLKSRLLAEVEESLKIDPGEFGLVPQLFEQAEMVLAEEGGSAQLLTAN
jgi:tetratricopeptide (TPR) repeat protein